MRCLYIVSEDPISPDFRGGASAMYYDQLFALANLGCEIHLWHYASPDRRAVFDDFNKLHAESWNTLLKLCKTIHTSTHKRHKTLFERALCKAYCCLSTQIPIPQWDIYRQFKSRLLQVDPDLIWAQHFEPGALAAQQFHVPFVYVHHDWLYRIKSLRNNRPFNSRQKVIEEHLVRRASAVLSGSFTECQEITKAGSRSVHYIPVTYDRVPLAIGASPLPSPRIVHLGGMGTTANREGLAAFIREVWPQLQNRLELWIVGDISGAPPLLQQQLASFHCTGFVSDLTTVLRPFDIQIIPWQHATGQRTRLPLAFNHAQVVVATRASVACYPEAVDGQNCRLVDGLSQMADAIDELSRNPEFRQKLGRHARATFEACFTRPSVLPKYQALLQTLFPVQSCS
ncbi:MAG TPA: glycosyltransferase family 4 protein [Clostridia bacterium]|nr:glycosyltransferase family 4 protein [Clostridia bacterium]